ncbi:hypothetical protein BC828DRAFT_387227 [Blastocladiella britannica]|nr:hypothetical protein BC828DRAFT_387227 [Blastocladiella britannica]
MSTTTNGKFVVMYGSQTGTAESIAQGIAAEAASRGATGPLLVLDDYDSPTGAFSTGGTFILVCSSTGDGDPPDNAHKCFRGLRKLKPVAASKPLAAMQFCILGLGDTNYDNFQKSPKRLRAALLDLGASEFYKPAYADDATGLEEVVDPWTEGLWPVLASAYAPASVSSAANDTSTSSVIADSASPDLLATLSIAEDASVLAPAPIPRVIPDDLPSHTFGKLAIASLPDLATLTTLTHLPKLVAPTVTVVPTGSHRRIDPDAGADIFYQRYASAVTGAVLPPYSAHKPVLAHVRSTETMTAADAVKRVVAVQLTVPSDSAWDWTPGDAFGVVVPTPHHEALAVAAMLGLATYHPANGEGEAATWTSPVMLLRAATDDAELPMSVRARPLVARPTNLPPSTQAEFPDRGHYYSGYEILRYIVDVRGTPKKALLRALADSVPASDAAHRLLFFLCSKQGAPTYRQWVADQIPTLTHVLASIPSAAAAAVPLDVLLTHMAPLTPRYYSHTNTPLDVEGGGRTVLGAMFNEVEYSTANGEARKGLASTHLAHLRPGAAVAVFPHPSATFHLPSDLSAPLIFIGPGTGMAPLLGMLRHRAAQRAIQTARTGTTTTAAPKIIVVQGCRDPARDWLAGSEITQYAADGLVTQHIVAFSRVDPATNAVRTDKYYVQDAIRAHASELAPFIGHDGAGAARIYVCGDAGPMARGIMDAVVDVVAAARGVEKKDAAETVMGWVKDGRYMQDLW